MMILDWLLNQSVSCWGNNSLVGIASEITCGEPGNASLGGVSLLPVVQTPPKILPGIGNAHSRMEIVERTTWLAVVRADLCLPM
jgi:hypothetical protein